jgi:hypothetical protein
MRKILFAFLTMLLLIFSLLPAELQAEEKPAPGQVIIYMIDKLDLNDLNPEVTPNLWAMQNKAGLGLLNTLSAGERTSKNVPCTISAGKLALGSSNADLNFKANEIIQGEKVSAIFFRNTGFLPADNNIVINSIEAIKKNNEDRGLGKPGQLGDELHALGLKTAVIGNADLPGYYSRPGALIVMDSRGIVDSGLIGKEVVEKSSPLQFSSNYKAILQAYNDYSNYDVVLIDFGDLARLDRLQSLLSNQQLEKERHKRLQAIDTCIGSLQEQINNKSVVYVISPTPSRAAFERGELLTPLIIDKPGFSGVLTSYSTRREGIVSSINLKNSILHGFNPAISDTIYAQPAQGVYTHLKTINQRAVFDYVNQPWIVTIHIAIILLFLVLALGCRLKKKSEALTDYLILFALAIPLELLLIANFAIFNRWLFLCLSLGVNLILTLFCWFVSRPLRINPLTTVLSLTIVVIALDLIFSLGMIEHSILSYRIMSGSRYYGLGNEYMGILIGATIAFTALLLQKSFSQRKLILVALLFSLIVFLIAYPLFGINVGGSITACIGLGYTYLRYRQQHINFPKIFFLILGTFALVAVMAIIDLKQPVEIQSHLGRSVNLIFVGGWEEMLSIISRKVQMQLRVLNYSIWGWVLLLLVLFSAYLVFRPAHLIKKTQQQLPVIYGALQGITMAAIIAIIVNDSGITAAAVLALYFVALGIKFLNSESG